MIGFAAKLRGDERLDVFLSDLVPPAHDARAGLPGPQVSALARTVEGPPQA
jgi:hypothetical protein